MLREAGFDFGLNFLFGVVLFFLGGVGCLASVAEMSDSTVKNSSCLAIAEKKSQKPGGCAGVFFQLFEWKRKLAKKKLFSKKLLPPG